MFLSFSTAFQPHDYEGRGSPISTAGYSSSTRRYSTPDRSTISNRNFTKKIKNLTETRMQFAAHKQDIL